MKNEAKLHKIRQYLVQNNIQHAHFYEPDIGNELTALATEPITGERRRLFRKFQLLKEKSSPPIPDGSKVFYVVKDQDGYFRWMGECGSSNHRVANIEDANWFETDEDAEFALRGGEVIKVTCSFTLSKGGAQ